MLSELNKSKDNFFVEQQRTLNSEMRELESKEQSEITECNRKIDLLKSEQEQ